MTDLPAVHELTEMLRLVTANPNADWHRLSDLDQRLKIIELVLRNQAVEMLSRIDDSLDPVGEWFKKSRLYEP